ncbi:hypothetical protein CHLRE_03g176150v5 [Chlamydomonas reinhardtii]|uniref:Uncharacterized protein n=1 Tax=Chlamydomonas reinhardtii TaxID=3055 RepID=A8IDY5_CHLRE|nr:uncharacterized protein CHLRE_03g176150v5 [Chlamydomonas reinhardtii]PNW85205.1 hypothetical protein CHLRE_03g176150v5 [Chlamydomonas reinhardtii]|eukprot:XP_001703441.1 hypothetical protein CHLREDRAFT_182800 [Chlamydomonas reinhardtii]
METAANRVASLVLKKKDSLKEMSAQLGSLAASWHRLGALRERRMTMGGAPEGPTTTTPAAPSPMVMSPAPAPTASNTTTAAAAPTAAPAFMDAFVHVQLTPRNSVKAAAEGTASLLSPRPSAAGAMLLSPAASFKDPSPLGPRASFKEATSLLSPAVSFRGSISGVAAAEPPVGLGLRGSVGSVMSPFAMAASGSGMASAFGGAAFA